MTECDLVIRGGVVVTASDVLHCDVGISGERITALAEHLEGRRVIDAKGMLVLPGGVDSHCHVEQLEADGSIHEESFKTAAISAFAGGTTTIIPFAPQFKGELLHGPLADYRCRAKRSPIDYAGFGGDLTKMIGQDILIQASVGTERSQGSGIDAAERTGSAGYQNISSVLELVWGATSRSGSNNGISGSRPSIISARRRPI